MKIGEDKDSRNGLLVGNVMMFAISSVALICTPIYVMNKGTATKLLLFFATTMALAIWGISSRIMEDHCSPKILSDIAGFLIALLFVLTVIIYNIR